MTLRYWVRETTGGNLLEVTGRVRNYILDVTAKAEEGSVAISSIVIDDPLGDLVILPHKIFAIEETEAETSTNRFVYVGYTGTRTISRGPYLTGPGRIWTVELVDINSVLSRRVMTGGGNSRPAENDNTRVQWVENTSEGSLIDDDRYLSSSNPVAMDAVDYTGQESLAVYSDCSQASGKNFFVTYFGDVGTDPWGFFSLWYDFDASTEYQSTLRLTNDLADVDGVTTFHIGREVSEQSLDPSRLYSGVYLRYDGGAVYDEDSNTYTVNGARRDFVAPSLNVKSNAKATARAGRYLADLATEDVRFTLTTTLPRAKVNGIREGMAVQVKMVHSYQFDDAYYWMRVLSRRVVELSEQSDGSAYELTLELSGGGVVPPVPATCDDQTANGSYPINGSAISAGTGNVFYMRGGSPDPGLAPNPGYNGGGWHFPEYNSGSVDYAGDCGGNTLRCLVIGDGTATIETRQYGGAGRTLTWQLMHFIDGNPNLPVIDDSGSVAAGNDIVVAVSSHSEEFCAHVIDVTDNGALCGSKWGFAGFDWVGS